MLSAESAQSAFAVRLMLLLRTALTLRADVAHEVAAASAWAADVDKIDEDGPCVIERVHWQNMTTERFESEYKEQKPVIIITGLDYNAKLRSVLDRKALLAEYGDMLVTVSIAPERDLPASYSGGRYLSVPLREYIKQMMTVAQDLGNPGDQSWYLFGRNVLQEVKEEIQDHYRVPPFKATVEGRNHEYTTLSLGLAGKYSGVPFHEHGPGWSEVLHGRKRWFLYPKDITAPLFNPLASQWEWVHDAYPTLSPDQKPWECTLYPGEQTSFLLRFPHELPRQTLDLS
jgi:hypothetical protein